MRHAITEVLRDACTIPAGSSVSRGLPDLGDESNVWLVYARAVSMMQGQMPDAAMWCYICKELIKDLYLLRHIAEGVVS